MSVYDDTALANARAQDLSSDEVAAMGYEQIAALAEVTLDENGQHPDDPDFIYRNVRTYVVNALVVDEEAAEDKEEEDLILASLKLVPSTAAGKKLKQKGVYRNEDGDIVIK